MWLYENKIIESIEDMPEGTFGYVYQVTHIPTGLKYIGKKQLISNRTLPPLKGTKRKRKIQKESDWKTYYGSQAEIKDLVKTSTPEDFTRSILRYCFTKKELTYREIEEQVLHKVLEDDDFLNSNISGRYFRKDLK